MDGKSIAPLILDAEDPAVLPATREHLLREAGKDKVQAWRTHHFVEYYSLGKVSRYGHLVDDPDSNTYRALRFLSGGPVGSGNMLYSEFTAVKDWDFSNYSFVEIFDMDKDPYQLKNLASTTSAAVKAQLHDQVQKQWECKTSTCP